MDKKRYIAELTDVGIYNLLIITKTISSSTFMLNNKVTANELVELEDGTQRLIYGKDCKEFKDLDSCMEFISEMNRL